MANLRLAMDAGFWDLNVASPQTLDGAARSVACGPAPLPSARASRTDRPLQLSFLRNVFPLGLIPSLSPTPYKELGSFSLQSTLLSHAFSNIFFLRWVGLVGQFRPRKLISMIKKEVTRREEMDLSIFRDIGKHFFDKSIYAIGLLSQFYLTDDTTLMLNVERHGERKGRRAKAVLFHKLPNHDVSLEAAWPELYVERNGTYWEVPSSASLDVSSLISESGFRYRFGLHKSDGNPEGINFTHSDTPSTLMPGIWAKAAISLEKAEIYGEEGKKKVNKKENQRKDLLG
ncbi:hypothetical protein KSP40_PGU016681 [Platanthera guangdongensis]|uniref:Uncharacterized protein n=1 Tax=Platanthera guangdongensis TaxID=2320717 RepID=A0ABR2ME30_9ASPA